MSWTNGSVNELWIVSERRKMKAADISTIEIMRFIRERSMEELEPNHWTSDPSRRPRWVWCWDFDCEPWNSMPWKVVVAKLAKLERRGLISACLCGCRMDIEITEAGDAFLRANDLADSPLVGAIIDDVADEIGRAFDRYPPKIAEQIRTNIREAALRPAREVG